MELTSYVIIGAVVSLIVQYLKNKFETESKMTLLIVIGISLVAGTIYFFLKDTNYWTAVLSILGFAGAVYTYIVKRFE